ADLARISRQLVTLERNVPVEVPLDGLARVPFEPGKLFPFLKAMEFASATRRIATLIGADPDAWEPDPELAATPVAPVGFDNAQRARARAERLEAEGRGDAPVVLHAAHMHE